MANPDNLSPELMAAAFGIGKLKRHLFICLGPDCCPSETGENSWEFIKKRMKELNIAGKNGPLESDTVSRALEEFYALGIKPDWWKLEPQTSAAAWQNIGAAIATHDPYCRGIVLLGLEAPEAALEDAFRAAAGHSAVKGFAIGRTIFNDAASAWLSGGMSDEAAIADMAERFQSLVELWHKAQKKIAA